MAHTLCKNNIKLTIAAPEEEYEASRFDHNGGIVQIHYRGIPLLSNENVSSFNPYKMGQGLYGEFGIRDAVGFDEIKEGEWFPKIGTAWLKKSGEKYSFTSNYETMPLHFESASIDDGIIFTCTSDEINGWSYTYSKTITILEDGFTEKYYIKNTGSKEIKTSHYVHNFFNPAQDAIGPHISLTIPWSFNPQNLVENVKTADILSIYENKITFIAEPKSDYFLGGITTAYLTNKDSLGWWKLEDRKNNISIKEEDDFIPNYCDIWGYTHNISCEMFYGLNIKPEESACWIRKWTITDIKN